MFVLPYVIIGVGRDYGVKDFEVKRLKLLGCRLVGADSVIRV